MISTREIIETVAAWRKDFADLANHYLEKNNFDARIDHRSYADRGIDLEATLHEGSAVTAMKRKYEREQLKPVEERNPKIIMPIIALENNAIKARNAEKQQILKRIRARNCPIQKGFRWFKATGTDSKSKKISMKPRLEPQNKLIQPRKQKYVQNHQNLKKIA